MEIALPPELDLPQPNSYDPSSARMLVMQAIAQIDDKDVHQALLTFLCALGWYPPSISSLMGG